MAYLNVSTKSTIFVCIQSAVVTLIAQALWFFFFLTFVGYSSMFAQGKLGGGNDKTFKIGSPICLAGPAASYVFPQKPTQEDMTRFVFLQLRLWDNK